MAVNQFLVWSGTSGGYSATVYAALSNLTTGVVPGIADPEQANATWRQTSTMAAMIGQFIVNFTGLDADDTGSYTTILTNFETAVSGRLLKSTLVSASGSFTPYTVGGTVLTRFMKVRGVGGGGAGGGVAAPGAGNCAAAGGGGYGGFGEMLLTAGFSAGLTIVVGAGGVGSSAANGGAGGNTTVSGAGGVLLTFPGAGGGALGSVTSTPQLAAGGAGGTVATVAGTGASALLLSGGSAALQGMVVASNQFQSGHGASGRYGSGGGGLGDANGSGGTPTGYGAGGAGAGAFPTFGPFAGAGGASGAVWVDEFA